jgi:predicted nucleic acid-binding protein
MEILDINNEDNKLINLIIQMRKDYRLKLPEAILAATAISSNSDLITNDKAFQKLQEITVITF